MVIKLTSQPDRSYGDDDLASKYVNDDGGPSYWWRDKTVVALHRELGNANLPMAIQNEIVDLVRFEDVEMLDRFEHFVSRKRVGEIDNADTLLSQFSRKETESKWLDRTAGIPFLLLFALGIGLLTTGFQWWHVVFWGAAILSSLGAVYAVYKRDGEYLDRKMLNRLRAERTASAV